MDPTDVQSQKQRTRHRRRNHNDQLEFMDPPHVSTIRRGTDRGTRQRGTDRGTRQRGTGRGTSQRGTDRGTSQRGTSQRGTDRGARQRGTSQRENSRGRGGFQHDFSAQPGNTSTENLHRSQTYGSNQSLPVLYDSWQQSSRTTNPASHSYWNEHSNYYRHDAFENENEFYDDCNSVKSNESYGKFRSRGGRGNGTKTLNYTYSDEKKYPKIGVYWDIENCQIPSGKSALFLVKRIRDRFYSDHVEDEFVVVCDTSKLSRTVLDDLNNSTVDVINVNANSKNAADDGLRRRLRAFADRNEPPATIVLITGDVNFISDIHHLILKRRFKVILLYNTQATVALTISATVSLSYEEFVVDLPEAKGAICPSSNESVIKLVISNLPPNAPLNELRKCINMKLQNFKGKLQYVNMKANIAFVQFTSLRDAQTARVRLNEELILGSKIKVRLWHDKNAAPDKQLERPNSEQVLSFAECKNVNQKMATNSIQTISPKPNQMIPIKLEQKLMPKPDQKIPQNVVGRTENKLAAKTNKQSSETTNIENKGPPPKSSIVVMKTKNFPYQILFINLLSEFELSTEDMDGMDCTEGVKWFKIKCSSQNLAKRFVKKLTNLNIQGVEQIEVHAADWKPDPTQSSAMVSSPVAHLRKKLMEMKAATIAKYESKLGELQKKQVTLMDSSQSLHVTPEVRMKTADANCKMMEQLVGCFKKFDNVTNLLLEQLVNEKCDYKKLPADFEVECSFFEQFFPIYAYRDEIISMIKTKKMVILKGTQGCGKSTQLIQYIYHDGFANHGKIICIEPHKQLVGILGLQVANQLKRHAKKSKAQVLFQTSQMLLQEMSVDPLLMGCSCIIVDKVQHDCSLMELLLALLRRILTQRSDFFVVVLAIPSVTDEFGPFYKETSTIQVSMTTYPVITYWEMLKVNYLEQVVETVVKIVTINKSGDILVILSCPSEVQEGIMLLKKHPIILKLKKLRVMSLLFTDDFKDTWQLLQQSIIEGFRNIIFTTDDLEADVSLHNICFVVDVGLTMETMTTASYILKSNKYLNTGQDAVVRTSKAGMSTFGECYHFYNLDCCPRDKLKAVIRFLPSIILNLLKLKLNPMLFEYIQSPMPDEVCNILESLEKVGAVENNCITSLGEQIALVPLPVHHALLLVKCIEQKIGFEALLLCCICETLGSFVNITECQKFGSVNVMKAIGACMKWMNLNRLVRKSYAKEEKFNQNFFNCVQNKLTEIFSTLKSNGIKFKLNSTVQDWQQVLQRAIVQCWSDNFCYHQSSKDSLYIWQHMQQDVKMKCDLMYPKPYPNMIIFERLWTDCSGEYIHTYITIDSSVMNDVGKASGLVTEEVQNMIQESFSIHPVGLYLMRSKITGGNEEFLKQLEQTLSKIKNVPVNITVSLPKGEIIVHVPTAHKDAVIADVKGRLNEGRERLLKELWEYSIYQDSGISILWGSGAVIKFLLMPEEFVSVLFFMNSEEEMPSVLNFCKEQEQYLHFSLKQIKSNDQLKMQMFVMFASPSAAKKVYNAALEKQNISAKPKVLKRNVPQPSGHFRSQLDISWIRRKNKGLAILQFSEDNIYKSIGTLAKNILSHSVLKTCKPMPDFASFKVELSNLDSLLVKSAILEAVNDCLLETGIVLDDGALHVETDPAFKTSHEVLKVIQEQLVNLIQDVSNKMLKVELHQPQDDDSLWHATITGDDTAALSKLASLPLSTWDGFPLSLSTVYTWNILCTEQLFNFCIESLIPELVQHLAARKIEVEITNIVKEKQNEIQLKSSDRTNLLLVHYGFIQLLKTKAITIDLKEYPDGTFDNENSLEHFTELAKKHKAYVKYKKSNQQLIYLGPSSFREELDGFLNSEIASMKMESGKKDFVSVETNGLLRKLIEKYDPHLAGLRAFTGLLKLHLDIGLHLLSIVGNSMACEILREEIAQIEENLLSQCNGEASLQHDEQDICPVCNDSVHNCENHYRLEHCGHAYCMPCMEALIVHENPPIRCFHKDCFGILVFRDMNNFNLKHRSLLKSLEENSLQVYMQNNMYVTCPFPDCEGILRIENFCQICPCCFNAVCIACKSLYHFEESCDSFQKKKEDLEIVPEELKLYV